MPKTKLGKWSVGLILGFFALVFVGTTLAGSLYESVPAGDTVFADVINRPALALSMLAGFGAGMSSCVTGLISIIKRKERALLVFGATLIGAVLTFYLVGIILFPE